MSVIVKGMKMPKNCKECPFSDHEAWCLIPGNWRERYYCPDDYVSEHCPLGALPDKHGRLVDADEIVNSMNDMKVEGDVFVTAVNYVKLIINDADTIVEAEGE